MIYTGLNLSLGTLDMKLNVKSLCKSKIVVAFTVDSKQGKFAAKYHTLVVDWLLATAWTFQVPVQMEVVNLGFLINEIPWNSLKCF